MNYFVPLGADEGNSWAREKTDLIFMAFLLRNIFPDRYVFLT